jgi:hypothetical protein
MKDLAPLRQRQFSNVWTQIKGTIHHLNAKGDFEGYPILWLPTLRIQFTQLEVYLRTFDPALADIFNGRTKGQVDHRPLASHLEPLSSNTKSSEKPKRRRCPDAGSRSRATPLP